MQLGQMIDRVVFVVVFVHKAVVNLTKIPPSEVFWINFGVDQCLDMSYLNMYRYLKCSLIRLNCIVRHFVNENKLKLQVASGKCNFLLLLSFGRIFSKKMFPWNLRRRDPTAWVPRYVSLHVKGRHVKLWGSIYKCKGVGVGRTFSLSLSFRAVFSVLWGFFRACKVDKIANK